MATLFALVWFSRFDIPDIARTTRTANYPSGPANIDEALPTHWLGRKVPAHPLLRQCLKKLLPVFWMQVTVMGC